MDTHRYLCSAKRPHYPIEEFKRHASETNEIFMMALKIYSRVASLVKKGIQIEDALMELRVFAKGFWWDVKIIYFYFPYPLSLLVFS